MALILGDDVVPGLTQQNKTKAAPTPAPTPASPAQVYDYQAQSDPYTALPGTQGYATPPASVNDPYWVNDPAYGASGGGYTLDPNTGQVWIESLGRWGSLSELSDANYGPGTGAYGEYVAPAGLATPPAPPPWEDTYFEKPQPLPPAPLVIENQVTSNILPWAPDPTMQNPDTQVPYQSVDMTPSSLQTPNITQGNWTWDSTLQTWVDNTGGYIWNPILNRPQTRAQYLDFVTQGTSAAHDLFVTVSDSLASQFPFVENAAPDYLAPMDQRGGTNPEWLQAADDLGRIIQGDTGSRWDVPGLNFPGTYVEDLPPPTGISRFPDLYEVRDAPPDIIRLSIVGDDGIRRNYLRLKDGSVIPADTLQDIPGVLEYVRGPDGQIQYERNPVGELVPMTKATMTGTQMLAEGLDAITTALTASPYQLDEFDSIRAKLPSWVNEAIEGSTSLAALATLAVPISGVSGKAITAGLNVAQNFIYSAAYASAKEAGAPESLAVAIGFIAAGGSEMALGRVTSAGAVEGLRFSEQQFVDRSLDGVNPARLVNQTYEVVDESGNIIRATASLAEAKLLVDDDALLRPPGSTPLKIRTVEEVFDPATSRAVSVNSEKLAEAAASPDIVAVRPTSLKAGDNILLSNAEKGPEFGTRQGYTVAEDVGAITPGSLVKITRTTDTGVETSTVEASRIWKVGETDLPQDVVLLNAGLPLEEVDKSFTAMWGLVNKVTLKGVQASVPPRVGVVLHPAGVEQLGKDFTPAAYKSMARQLIQTEVPNAIQQLQDSFLFWRRGLGRIKNDMLLDVTPTEIERKANLAHPFLADVVENPGNYVLTEKQLEAISNIAALNEAKKSEQILRGVETKFLSTIEGKKNYFPRVASMKGEQPFPESYVFGTNISPRGMFTAAAHDRIWSTQAEAYAAGIRFKSSEEAFLQHSKSSLQRAAYEHLATVARSAGTKAGDQIDPKYTEKLGRIKKMYVSFSQRLVTAEKRAGIYDAILDDISRVYDDVLRAAPDEDSASLRYLPGRIDQEIRRAEKLVGANLDDTYENAMEWVTASKESVSLLSRLIKEDQDNLVRAARRAGEGAEEYKAAENTARELFDRAVAISKRIKEKGDEIVRIKSPKGLTRAERNQINKEVRTLRKQLKTLGQKEVGVTKAASKIDPANAKSMFGEMDLAKAKKEAKVTVASLRAVGDERAGAEVNRAVARISQMIPEGADRLAYYSRVVDHTEKRIQRLTELGGKWKGIARELEAEREQAKQLLENYREIVTNVIRGEETKMQLAGKKMLPHQQFPKLAEVYFEPEMAEAVAQMFGPPKQGFLNFLKLPSRVMTPVLVTWDLSVYMTMLSKAYLSLALKKPSRVIPTATAQFGESGIAIANKIFRTNIDNSFDYLEWKNSARVAFAGRHMPLRGEDIPDELIFMKGFNKVPGVQAAQKHFTRTWNRTMVELFYAEVDSVRASGRVMSDNDYEAIGRAVGRIGGIPWNKASEVENTFNFAANYFRSRLETHYYALAKGGLEGHLARQHLLTYYTAMSAIAAGVALSQDRNPFEVISPVDLDALSRGEFRFNSNFMTIRVANQDLNIVPDRALITLLWTAVEGPTLAILEKDPSRLYSALYYMTSVRANPQFKLAADAIVGHDFGGDPFLSWKSMAKRVLPITFQNIIQNYQDDNLSISDQVVGAVFAAMGASINPMTEWEQRDAHILRMELFSDGGGKQYLLDKNRPPSYLNLNRAGRLLVDNEYGRIEGKSWDSRVRATKRAVIAQDTLEKLQANDRAFQDQERDYRAWRMEYEKILAGDRKAKELLYGEYDYYNENDPVDRYFKQLHDLERPDGTIDFDRLEDWLRRQPKSDQTMIEKYLNDTRKIYGSPVTDRFRNNSKALSDLGFYDDRDTTFAQWAESQGLPFTDLNEWKKSLVDDAVAEYAKTLDPTMPVADREVALSNYFQTVYEQVNNLGTDGVKVSDWNDYWYDSYLRDFIGNNPEVALEADTFGKLTIRKDEKDIIKELGISSEEDLRAAFASNEVLKKLDTLDDTWKKDAWTDFAFPAELGIERKDSYDETRQAWIASYHGKDSYDALTSSQKKTGGEAWDKMLGDNKDAWTVVDHQSRIMGFLNTWDSLNTDEEREAFLQVASQWSWVSNKSDSTLLYRASLARGGAFSSLFEDKPWVKDYKVDTNTYLGSGEAILYPSAK